MVHSLFWTGLIISADSRGSPAHDLVSEMRQTPAAWGLIVEHGKDLWLESSLRLSQRCPCRQLCTGHWPISSQCKKGRWPRSCILALLGLPHSTKDGSKPSIHRKAETVTVRYNAYLQLFWFLKNPSGLSSLFLSKCLILLYPPSACILPLHIVQNKCSFTSIVNKQPC